MQSPFEIYREAHEAMHADLKVLAVHAKIDMHQQEISELMDELTPLEAPHKEIMNKAEAEIIKMALSQKRTISLFGITAKYRKGRRSTSWKSVAEMFSPSKTQIESHTKQGEPSVSVVTEKNV